MPKNYVCSTAAGCNQTFVRFSELKKHEARHAARGLICTWPGCDFATLIKASYDIHFDKHTGEQRYVCPHDDCDFKTHNPAVLTCHRKKCHGYVPLPRGRGTPSATGSGGTPSSQPQPSGLSYEFAPVPMQPQPNPTQPMQSHLAQYQPQSTFAHTPTQHQPDPTRPMQSHSTQYQPQSTQRQPPIHNPLGVLYGPVDTADDYTMYTGPAKASHGWTEGCVCPELMQRRASEMPGYEYRRY